MKDAFSCRSIIIDALLFNRLSTQLLIFFLFRRSQGATIFLYHLVCQHGYHPFLKSGNLPRSDVDLFKNQLRWLMDEGFSFFTVDELATAINDGKEISQKIVVVTFDDGFKATIDNALPILKSLGMKATFFVTTDWIDSDILLWQQKYYWYVKHYGLKDFFDNAKEVDEQTFKDLDLSQCHKRFMYGIQPEQKEKLLKLYNKHIPEEKELALAIYPSSGDITKLSASGMEVGSHSCGHHYMKNLPDDLYYKEMLDSRLKLENLLKKPIASFSYPFNSYRNDDQIIKKTGYKTICTVAEQKVYNYSSLAKFPRFIARSRKLLFKNSLRKIIYFYN